MHASQPRCESTSTDPLDHPIRCRRPFDHRGPAGGPGWHACGELFWNDDGVCLRWGDEAPKGGPFTPAHAHEDQLPADEDAAISACGAMDAMFSKATAQLLIKVTKERDELARSLGRVHQSSLVAMSSQLNIALEQRDASRKEGYALATEDVAQWLEGGAWEPPVLSVSNVPFGALRAIARRVRAGDHRVDHLAQEDQKETSG